MVRAGEVLLVRVEGIMDTIEQPPNGNFSQITT